MRRLLRFLGRTTVRLVVVAVAVVLVVAPIAAFTARDVDGPWMPVNGVCYRRVERIAFNRITIDQHFAIGSMRLCEAAAEQSA
jgi:hypothetical protein